MARHLSSGTRSRARPGTPKNGQSSRVAPSCPCGWNRVARSLSCFVNRLKSRAKTREPLGRNSKNNTPSRPPGRSLLLNPRAAPVRLSNSPSSWIGHNMRTQIFAITLEQPTTRTTSAGKSTTAGSGSISDKSLTSPKCESTTKLAVRPGRRLIVWTLLMRYTRGITTLPLR